jgi:glycosyltransferase involved in cell wall biosynthesis
MSDTVADVSVVICTHSEWRWEWLLDAIESVQKQHVAPRELVIVVDHNAALLTRVRAAISGVIAVENRQQPGLSGARNSGVAAASSEIVAFLDDDETADPDWLLWLCQGYSDRRVLGVGGAVLPQWAASRPSWFPSEFDWVVGCSYRGMPETVAPVRNLLGGNMSFRRTVFAQIGGFTLGLGRTASRPMGCEETEFCIRLLQRRPEAVLLYDDRPVVRARVPVSRTSWGYFSARCYAEGLSKACVTQRVGTADGLATERRYVLRTLPMGVAEGLRDAARRDSTGLSRAGAIVSGAMVTTGGYAVGKLMAWRRAAGQVIRAWRPRTGDDQPDEAAR